MREYFFNFRGIDVGVEAESLKSAYQHFEATDLDFVQDKSLDFCKNQCIKNAIINNFDDYKKYFCMHTYDYTILGACVRMIEFACFLGVSHLDFTGLDGVEAILEGKHAFQPGKTELPGVLKARAAYSSPSSLKNDSVYVFQASYTVFWERIRKQFPHIIFKNLGGGEHYHEIIMRSNPV